MITHEEAKRAFGNAMVSQTEDEYNFNCDIVEKYFKQQEKVSKLLELYREFGKQVDEFSEFAFSIYDEIQALEEELK